MKDPKISIIIPSYNQGEYLATCIESALDQALKPHEIIVVDDGSTDLSLAIAEQYTAKGVKVVSQSRSFCYYLYTVIEKYIIRV